MSVVKRDSRSEERRSNGMTKFKRVSGSEKFKVNRRGIRVRPEDRTFGKIHRETVFTRELLEREERLARSPGRADDGEVVNDCKTLTRRAERSREEWLYRDSKSDRGEAISLTDSIGGGD